MKRSLPALLFISWMTLAGQAPHRSFMQEQSESYRALHLTSDAQWDSLRASGNIPSSGKYNQGGQSCTLTKRVFGWHPYWNGSVYTNYDWSMLSDFCYFDYSVSPTTGQNTNGSFAWSSSAAVTTAKANGKKIHICATMFASHSTFWASPSAQATCINTLVSLLNSRNGNGINIDFEGMGSADKTPFKNFMINLKNALVAANPNYELSVALYAVDWNTSFDIPNLNSVVNAFIIMGYDYYYSGSAQAGPEAPLYNFQTSYNYTLSKSLTYYLKAGATPSKLLLGLPYYGREWETVSNAAPANTTGNFTTTRLYNYVRSNSTTYSTANKKWESNCYNPYYTYLSAGNWRQCWIDDIYSMGRKFDMVIQRGIGGIGIWALGYDDGYNDYWQLIKDKFSTCQVRPCTDSLFDMGGPTRNYYDNESYTYSIAPNGSSQVQLQFKSFGTEQGYDSLFIYNGASSAAPLIGAYTGTNSPGTVTSTGTVITVRFKSDGATVNFGFKIVYSCVNVAGIREAGENDQVVLYPNPSNGVIQVTSPYAEGTIELLNELGQVVYRSELNNDKAIDLTTLQLKEGIYLVRISSGEKRMVRKLIYRK